MTIFVFVMFERKRNAIKEFLEKIFSKKNILLTNGLTE